MSFTVCSPGCCLLRGPILLLSDKAALLFSLCNPPLVGKNRPKPSSRPPRLPPSPDITPSSILFPSRSCSAALLCGSLQHARRPFSALAISFRLGKTPLYFIDFFYFFPPFSCSPFTCAFGFFYSSLARAAAAHTPPPLHRSFPLSSSLMCRRF